MKAAIWIMLIAIAALVGLGAWLVFGMNNEKNVNTSGSNVNTAQTNTNSNNTNAIDENDYLDEALEDLQTVDE